MLKLLISVATALAVLSACAGRPANDATAGSPASSTSGVEFYGTIDLGVGSQRISR